MTHTGKATILNVDHCEATRGARTRILREAGYEVDEAATGAEALTLAGTRRPGVVLLAAALPDIDALEVCRRIKSDRAASPTLVMHISPGEPAGSAPAAERPGEPDGGADSYVVEPIEPGDLLAGVTTLLRLRNAERALHVASREWRTTFDSIEDGVCLLELDGTIRRVNLAFARIFNQPMEELIGTNCRDRLGPACTGLDRTIAAGEPQSAQLVAGERTYHIRFSPVRSDTGLQGVVGTFRDVTEIVRIEREREDLIAREQEARAAAEAASRVKDEFLATVSHDLRGPLQAILIWTRLLRESSLDEAARLRTIDSLDRSAHAQARLIDDLLDLSRVISGKLKLDMSPCDLRAITLITLETVHPSAEAKQISIDLKLDPAGAPILGDPDRLQQVIWNVLSNAVKFTPKQGRIEVRLERLADSVSLRVCDNGQGITPEFLPHVFENFRQGEEAGEERGRTGGLGLGLSIARRLVELHGGTIQVDSPGKGRGATFEISLPLNPDRSRPGPAGSSPVQS